MGFVLVDGLQTRFFSEEGGGGPSLKMKFVSNLLNNDSPHWSVSKYSVKHNHHTAPSTAPHHTVQRAA